MDFDEAASTCMDAVPTRRPDATLTFDPLPPKYNQVISRGE